MDGPLPCREKMHELVFYSKIRDSYFRQGFLFFEGDKSTVWFVNDGAAKNLLETLQEPIKAGFQ